MKNFVGIMVVVSVTACTPMRTLRGSSLTYLTAAGATIELARPGAGAASVLEQLFTERGFPVTSRAQVAPNNLVVFFKGTRDRLSWQNRTTSQVNSVGTQVGSWFAVRVKDDGSTSTVTFYGKPTIYGAESCADGDRELNDTGYTCTDVRVRADWPGVGLVEGREETQVISGIIATLGERLPGR